MCRGFWGGQTPPLRWRWHVRTPSAALVPLCERGTVVHARVKLCLFLKRKYPKGVGVKVYRVLRFVRGYRAGRPRPYGGCRIAYCRDTACRVRTGGVFSHVRGFRAGGFSNSLRYARPSLRKRGSCCARGFRAETVVRCPRLLSWANTSVRPYGWVFALHFFASAQISRTCHPDLARGISALVLSPCLRGTRGLPRRGCR